MKTFLRNNYIFIFPFLFAFVVFYKQILNPFEVTFNFADNWGYLSQIANVREYFLSDFDIPFWHTVIPLYTYLIAFLWYFVSDVFWLNFFYIWNILLAWFGSYRVFYFLSQNKATSFLGATLFAFNSLTIYANWINLMGLWFLPFIFYYILKWEKFKIFLFSILFLLSGHYYFLLLFVFILIYIIYILINKEFKINFMNLLTVLFATIVSILIYIFPVLYFWTSENIQNYSQINKIDIWYIDLIELFVPNSFNFITYTYWNKLYGFDSGLKYSYYFWILTFLLLVYSFFHYIKDKSNKIIKFFLIGFIVSLLFFLWWKLVVFWQEIIWFLPFRFVEIFWLQWVFRKSAYFFYILSFFAWWIIAILFRKTKMFIAIFISFWIILENNFSFDRGIHINKEYNFDLISKKSKVLVLPNTGYSIGKFKYNFYNNAIKVIDYPDSTIPFWSWQYENLEKSCFISNLLFLIEDECNNYTEREILEFFEMEKIDYIVLFKTHQVVYFFSDSWNEPNHYFEITNEKIKKYSNIFKNIMENKDYIIYKIK